MLLSRKISRVKRLIDYTDDKSVPYGNPPSIVGINYINDNKPRDPEWKFQWYLNRLEYKNYEHHLNVSSAWALGYSGKGSKVTIVEDGIEYDHPDLG